jgi:hypothetical protein
MRNRGLKGGKAPKQNQFGGDQMVGKLIVLFLVASLVLFSTGVTDTFGLGFSLTRGEKSCTSER